MANEKFFFIFGESPQKRVFIDEPIGYREVAFILQRQDDGMGFDVTLNGDENRFTLTDYRDHKLPELIYYRDRYKFEANVIFGIIFENGEELLSQVDFQTCSTNDYDYFEFSTITESSKQVFKRQMKTKVDMFSSLGINGEFIEPLAPVNMLLQAKPSIQESTWKIASEINLNVTQFQPQQFLNITQSIDTSDVKNSFVPFLTNTTESGAIENFKIIQAETPLRDVNISIKNVDLSVSANGSTKRLRIIARKGETFGTAEVFTIFDKNLVIDNTINAVGDFGLSLGDVQRGHFVWLYALYTQNTAADLTVIIKSADTKINAESTAYNSITPTFRLIDVMKQIAKSTAGLDVFAPKYNIGGEFYDTVLTNGKMLGGNISDPFYVSWEDVMESVKGEGNSGYEISLNGDVFVGTEKDFYTDIECGVFEDIQFDTLDKNTNEKMALNTFKLNFSNYQSLKENTEPNSGSTIHGESILTLPNKEVEGVREVKIPWIRDAILLDVQQRLSTIVSKDTATQDDDKIFAIDTISTESDQFFTETTELQHTKNTGYLSIKSDGSVNFLVLGIRTGTIFQILYPDPNAGSYIVSEVFNSEVRLTGNNPNASNNGARLTKYTYQIKAETIPLTNRTNQGFTTVLNLISPEKYSNMRYSVERIIRQRYPEFIASCLIANKDKDIINTYYKNNGACITEFGGLQVQEKENFKINDIDPLFTSDWYEGIVFANQDFEDFIALCNRLRTHHGFITMKDINRRVMKIYPDRVSYQNDSRQITIDGNEKFIKAYLTITNENDVILINSETTVTVLRWDLIDHKVELFDLERQRLYQGTYWYRVSINNSVANTLDEFIDRMNLIGEKFDSTLF